MLGGQGSIQRDEDPGHHRRAPERHGSHVPRWPSLSSRAFHVEVANTVGDGDHPEIARSLEHHSEEQADRENARKHGERRRRAREVVEMNRAEGEKSVRDENPGDRTQDVESSKCR